MASAPSSASPSDRHCYARPEWSFAGILVVGVIGILSDLAIRGANRLLFAWRESDA